MYCQMEWVNQKKEEVMRKLVHWSKNLMVITLAVSFVTACFSPPHESNDVWNAMVLETVREMPKGGGYSVRLPAAKKLANEAVVMAPEGDKLIIRPEKARPSFCSAACYLVLLRSLQKWETQSNEAFPMELWSFLDIELGQADGASGWGRANSNGPGLAKWVHETKTGYNFSSIERALPGDFLKIYWTKEIGAEERGHFVVFLGTRKGDNGETNIRYWSSNIKDGYGEKEASAEQIKAGRVLFTRITKPAAFVNSLKLPQDDVWLGSLLEKSVTEREMNRKVRIR